MFQDIAPHEFHNQFTPRQPQDSDYVILYRQNQAMLLTAGGPAAIPQYRQVKDLFPAAGDLLYLLSVDETAFYLSRQELEETPEASYHSIQAFREMQPDWLAFSGATALQLSKWYDDHRYCGRCAAELRHKETERALRCPECGVEEYPKISPVVMVAICDGDRLLLTRYAHAAYRRHALVAGFMEIGETLEEAVQREVMEEVGLNIKHLRYYKSQPWAFSESVLVGFFAEVDGSREIVLDETELAEAVWVARADLPPADSKMSLTWDMIEAFRQQRIK